MAGVSSDLELNIADALDSVSSIGDTLVGIATTFSDELAKAIAGAAEPQVNLTVDATLLNSEVQAALNETQPTVAPQVDAGQVATEIDQAVATASPEVSVTVDTGDLADQIDQATAEATASVAAAGAASGEAAKGLDLFGGAATGVAVATGLAKGETAGLTSAVEGAGGAIAGAVGVGTALAATYGLMFHEAEQARAADERLNIVFGAQAAAIQRINIGGLTGDLGDLAIQLGSSDEGLKQATATLGQMAQSAGLNDDRTKQFVQTIDALALRAVALNPALGEVGDVASRMGTALARGGRFAAQFGISLNPAEVSMRALRDTGKSSATELTIVEKSMAGAEIAAERLGGKLGTDFAKGAEQSSVQLKSLKQQLLETLEAAGKPLVEPTLQAFRDLAPVAKDLGLSLGEILAALVPVVSSLVSAFAPALRAAASAVSLIAVPLGLVADALAQIPAPILQAVGAFLTIRAVIPLLESATAATFAFATAGQVAEVSFGPVGIILAGLGAAAAALGVFGSSAEEAKPRVASLKEQIDGLDTSGKQLGTTFVNLDEKLATLLTGKQNTTSPLTDIFKPGQLADELKPFGLRIEDTIRQLQQGEVGLGNFGNHLREVLRIASGGEGGSEANTIFDALIAKFRATQKQLTDQAHAEIDAALASNTLTKSKLSELEATNRLADGTVDWLGVARQVEIIVSDQNGAIDQLSGSLGDNAATWRVLADDIATGKVALQDLPAISDRTGISIDKLQAAFDAAQKAVAGFADDVKGKIPSAVDVLGQIDKGFNAGELVKRLKDGAKAIRDFFGETLTFQSQGLTRTVALAEQLGPLQGGILLKGLHDAGPKIRLEFEAQLGLYQQAGVDAGKVIDAQAPVLANQMGLLAQGMNGALGVNLDFASPAQIQMAAVQAVITGDTSLSGAAAVLAASGTDAFGQRLLLEGVTTSQLLAASNAVHRDLGLPEGARLKGKEATDALDQALKLQGVTAIQIEKARQQVDTEKDRTRSKFGELGGAAAGGFLAGLEAIITGGGAVGGGIVGAIEGGIDAAKVALEIRSPSRLVARELGSPAGQGFVLGLADALKATAPAFATALADVPRVTLATPNIVTPIATAISAGTQTVAGSRPAPVIQQTFNEKIDPQHVARAVAFVIGDA